VLGSRWCLTPKVRSSRDRYKRHKDKKKKTKRSKKQREEGNKDGRAVGRSDLLLQSVFILLSLDLRHLCDNKGGAKRKERDYFIPKLVLSLGAGQFLIFSLSQYCEREVPYCLLLSGL